MRKKISEKRGAAMIAVLCVMAVFIALAFSILLTASVASSASAFTLNAEKCKIMAISLRDVLDHALKENSAEASGGEPKENDFQEYLHNNIAGMGWSYYSEGETYHSDKKACTRTFKDNGSPDGYTMEVKLYWSPPDNGDLVITDQSTYDSVALYLSVICTAGSQSYEAKSCYRLTVKEVTVTDGGAEIKKYEWKWDDEWED